MEISTESLTVLLEDATARDRTTARRSALFKILFHERCLTREQLIVRVEGILGKGCFGEAAWIDTFYRDMRVVKRALDAAGYHLAYSRSKQRPGYYLRNQPSISTDMSEKIKGSVNEIDPSQITTLKKFSSKQRFQQGISISNLACAAVAHSIRQRNPQLSNAESHRLAIQRAYEHDRQNPWI
jgi:hypothetical protein